MTTQLYLQLSALMFLEYAIWGAWMPVLAARLLGPLKMTGKQTGWIYATLPIGITISSLFAGQLADKYFDSGLILAVCHGIGFGLLFLAARIEKFLPLFGTMLLYCVLYGATIPLVNSLMFSHLTDPGKQAAGIFIWAPVAWTSIGVLLSAWRNMRKTENDGSDCLRLAAVLSILMTVICLMQPDTPPKGAGGSPLLEALALMKSSSFTVFILSSLVVAGTMQFYFLGTARFLTDLGASGKNVSGIMGIAQAAQALATGGASLSLLAWLFDAKVLGPKWTITLGAACWALLYLVYTLRAPKQVVIGSQVLHGLAYVFFMIAGQMYVDSVAPEKIRGSAQALIFLVTTGLGMFLGTQAAGWAMDKFSQNGQFDWKKIFLVPLVCTVAGVIALAVAF